MGPLKILLAASFALLISCSALGQGRNTPPAPGVLLGLESYANVQLVLKNARRTVELLGSAESKLEPYPLPFKPAPGSELRERRITPECDTEEIRSFNRGYLLAHAGFNLFLALQELGVARVSGPHGLPHEQKRRFIQFGRSALLNVWTPSRLRELLQTRSALGTLPKAIKQDLSIFLSKLLEYREHYNRLKTGRPGVLGDLFRREDDAYYWYRTYLERSKDTESIVKTVPTAISYSELSAMLDQRLREVSDVAKTDPAECFVEHFGPVITFPSEKLKYEHTYIFPTKYMVSFWWRRDMEGIGDLASYVITSVLRALRV